MAISCGGDHGHKYYASVKLALMDNHKTAVVNAFEAPNHAVE